MSFTAIKESLNNNSIYIELQTGTQQQAIDYYKKEDPQTFEFGKPQKPGKSKKIDEEMAEIKDMFNEGKTADDILTEKPIFYRYASFIKKYDRIVKEKKQQEKLKNWANSLQLNDRQKELSLAIQNQNDAQITWIYDQKGNTGKTIWSKYMTISQKAITFPDTQYIYAYNGEPIVIIDTLSSVRTKINYTALKDLKNGIVTAGRYKPTFKFFAIPKIIVLANFLPETFEIPINRWDIKIWS